MLTENECMNTQTFPDTVAHTGWTLDIHHPRGIFSGKEGPFHCNTRVPAVVHFPYRCLYSVNIGNLLFAGRDASVTHIALGTVRVQNTAGGGGIYKPVALRMSGEASESRPESMRQSQ